jgi:hypothetical protein
VCRLLPLRPHLAQEQEQRPVKHLAGGAAAMRPRLRLRQQQRRRNPSLRPRRNLAPARARLLAGLAAKTRQWHRVPLLYPGRLLPHRRARVRAGLVVAMTYLRRQRRLRKDTRTTAQHPPQFERLRSTNHRSMHHSCNHVCLAEYAILIWHIRSTHSTRTSGFIQCHIPVCL